MPTIAARFLLVANKTRLDQALVTRGLCDSREKAQRAILAGQVRLNSQPAQKPSDPVRLNDQVELIEPEKFVSRGGHKLEHALLYFGIVPKDWVAVDLGASTGGFTDCLLQQGVARVYAVDVGHGQLAWKLRQDSRVVVMEKTNARNLLPVHFPKPFALVDLAVIDCSFISLRLVLPPAIALVRPAGKIIALLKPQFEAGKSEVDKGAGVITDPTVHERVLAEIRDFVKITPSVDWKGEVESPLLGPAGNKEFLVLIEKNA